MGHSLEKWPALPQLKQFMFVVPEPGMVEVGVRSIAAGRTVVVTWEPSPPPPALAAEALGQQRIVPTPFLTKTVDDIILWNDDGSTFIVWRPDEFACDLLPTYFKHNFSTEFCLGLPGNVARWIGYKGI
uniref:HSF-type DNA-binding domain-containing protein n=1 Tax=Oryza punctata TaxID=4537 RepID=A0A0E0KFE1_ORYPU